VSCVLARGDFVAQRHRQDDGDSERLAARMEAIAIALRERIVQDDGAACGVIGNVCHHCLTFWLRQRCAQRFGIVEFGFHNTEVRSTLSYQLPDTARPRQSGCVRGY
jgi:hypothetical protein